MTKHVARNKDLHVTGHLIRYLSIMALTRTNMAFWQWDLKWAEGKNISLDRVLQEQANAFTEMLACGKILNLQWMFIGHLD